MKKINTNTVQSFNGVWTITDQTSNNELGILVVDNQGIQMNEQPVEGWEFDENKRCLSWGTRTASYRFVREPNGLTGNAFVEGKVYNDIVGKREI